MRLLQIMLIVMSLAGLVVAIPVIVVDPWLKSDLRLIPIAVLVANLVTIIASAPITFLITVNMADRGMQFETYQLMRVSNLIAGRIFDGYVLAIVHRLRLLWALILGCLLPGFASITQILLAMPINVVCAFKLDCWFNPPASNLQFLPVNMGLSLIIALLGVLFACALNWLAICSGLWLVFWRRGIR